MNGQMVSKETVEKWVSAGLSVKILRYLTNGMVLVRVGGPR